MATGSKNGSLSKAKAAKQDEFYTQLSDIEAELQHYTKHFKGKVVYCNCDDPRVSGFFHYFSYNFERLGLKRLLATCYKSIKSDLFSQNDSDRAVMLEYTGDKDGNRVPDPQEVDLTYLNGDGDFRSEESLALLKQADIVVTNPPFSLFREYIAQLVQHKKKFVVIGSKNAITYKEIFPLIKENRMWVGCMPMSRDMLFSMPKQCADHLVENGANGSTYRVVDGVVFGRSPSIWYTNLDHAKRHEELILYRTYTKKDYPKYDNYDAIEVSKVKDIPADYDGAMGVPITFLDKYNPEQFEIVGVTQSWSDGRIKDYPKQIQVSANGTESAVTKLNDGAAIEVNTPPSGKAYYKVRGKRYVKVYARVLIKRRK